MGGGIGGLALAIALLKEGIECEVFERDKSFCERSQGYGLTMQQVSPSERACRRSRPRSGAYSDIETAHARDPAKTSSQGAKTLKRLGVKLQGISSTIHLSLLPNGELIGAYGREWREDQVGPTSYDL